MKNRWVQLNALVCAVVAMTAVVSHFLVFWLSIGTRAVDHRVLGDQQGQPLAYLAGSSLMGDGLAWDRISRGLGQGMETWFVAGSSPSEWEPFQCRAPEARLTILVVSAYDLNEDLLSDFRSDVVSLPQTLRDLVQSRSGWAFAKRVVSQYPLKYVRILFPTVGRSQGVMEGLRDQLRKLARPWVAIESDASPTVPSWNGSVAEREKTEKISDWSSARMLRRLSALRTACQDGHRFNGPKKLAFLRMLHQARAQGRVIVVVLPVSPTYQKEFLNRETAQQFEDLLGGAGRAVPEALWVRMDQLPQLNTDDYFWDLVHMNTFGKEIATEVFLGQLRKFSSQP